jgi:hypothetical protein
MGLFESYDYTQIEVNGHISEAEFQKDYKEYRFN